MSGPNASSWEGLATFDQLSEANVPTHATNMRSAEQVLTREGFRNSRVSNHLQG
jgi:hypothetical protein